MGNEEAAISDCGGQQPQRQLIPADM